MIPERIPAFFAVLVLVLVTPGPDFLVVVRYSVTGLRRGLTAGAGIVCGLLVHTAAAAAGLSALVTAYPPLLDAIRIAGACYLAWLGVAALRAALRPAAPSAEAGAAQPARGHPFRDGAATNVLNPKALLFFVGLLPQFVTSAANVLPQTLVLAGICIATTSLWWSAVSWVASRGGRLLRTPRSRRGLDGLTALGFLGLAGVLLL